MKRDARENYNARMQRVLVYIDEHLDADLSVDVLSRVAAFSKHHFQRQFSSTFGLSVQRYVQLVRFKSASYKLAFRPEAPVLQIALDSGYEGPEAFARAFRQRIEQSPREFRNTPQWEPWHAALWPVIHARSTVMTQTFSGSQVSIVNFATTRVAVMTHRGNPALIGDTVRRFIAWRKAEGLSPKHSATFNVFHDDPVDSSLDDYRLDLCAATDRAIPTNNEGVMAGEIPGGSCAVLRVIGSSDDLGPAARFLYGIWLPESGRELRDFPIFAQRVRFFPDVPEHESITDLYLPLK